MILSNFYFGKLWQFESVLEDCNMARILVELTNG